jgi:hypothetical protein
MGERGQTGERSPADEPLGDPEEHPEQHAAQQTGEQAKGESDEGTDNELLDSEEHSDAEGPFGTADPG